MMTLRKKYTSKNDKKQVSVYKNSEFSDLLMSNNFYTVSGIALVLGFASAFGFIQNPRKLKTVVDTLSYKVSVSHTNNQQKSFRIPKYKRHSSKPSEKGSVVNNIQRVAFSYDLTSDKFWNDLDSANNGKAKEDINKENYSSHSSSLLDDANFSLEKDDSKYSIATNLRKR